MPVVGAVAAPLPETRLIFSVDIDEACVWTWIASLLPKRSLRAKPRWRSDESGVAEELSAPLPEAPAADRERAGEP